MVRNHLLRPFGLLFLLLPFFHLGGEIIERVVFQGNRQLKSRILSQVVVSQKGREFSEEVLGEDIKSLTEFYQKEGFLSVRVSGQSRGGKKGRIVIFQIAEGYKCKIDSLIFSGKEDEGVRKLLFQKGYGFYSANKVRELKEVLLDYYLNAGYYYVDLRVETALVSPEKMNLIVEVEEGPLTYLKEIKFLGLRRIRIKDALRTTELKKGEKYSKKKIYQAARKLYATNLFANIYFKVSPLHSSSEKESDKRSESLEVRFDCQELKERIFGFGLGYASPPSRTYHSISWQHLNFFRKVHNLKVLFELNPDWRGSYNLSLKGSYRVPYVSWTKINFLFQPYLFWEVDKNKRKKTWELGEEAGFFYDFTENLQGQFFNKYRRFWGKEDSTRSVINSLNLNFLYDTRDDFFSPTSGIYSFSLTEWAGGLLGGNWDFYRLSQEVRFFFPFLFTQAFRLTIGSLFPYGRTTVLPDYGKFYLGGMTTLRGYDEKSLPGERFFLGNWEWRFLIYKILGGVIFFDLGFTNLSTKIAYDLGIGLRLASPVGPWRIDFAVAPPKFASKNWWKINFGLGNVF
ncbi:MAG: BamA/TamA family outer membrane protein [candidate division WOR-3 bacterium]